MKSCPECGGLLDAHERCHSGHCNSKRMKEVIDERLSQKNCPQCGGPLNLMGYCSTCKSYFTHHHQVGHIEFNPTTTPVQQPVYWWTEPEFKDATTSCSTDSKTWDTLFMRIAKLYSEMSKCSSRKVGVIIVRDHQILSGGFNGSPAGSNLCQNAGFCPRKRLGYKSGEAIHLCPATHGESNAIVRAGKHGIAIDGATMYCYCTLPCKACAGQIINSGIKKVVCLSGEHYDTLAELLFKQANVEIVYMNL